MNKQLIIITLISLLLITSIVIFNPQEIEQSSDIPIQAGQKTDQKAFQLNVEKKTTKAKKIKSIGHKCQHDSHVVPLMEKEKLLVEEFEKELENLEQTQQTGEDMNNWKPIRIKYDFSYLQQLTVQQKDFIQNKIFPVVQSYFENTIQVHQVTGPIIVNPYLKTQKCNGEIMIPTIYLQNGVQNADMLMVIGSINDPKQSFLAYASTCEQSSYNLPSKRPTLGYFMINLFYMNNALTLNKTSRWNAWIDTFIHEQIHSLGFSSSQFKNFENAKIISQNNRFYYIGQNAVEQGQKHFNCYSNNALPLEEAGSSGSAGSHWDQPSFGNEGLTSSDFGDSVFSAMTLGLLKDSGWYNPNFNMAQPLSWGKQSGCATMNGQCDQSQALDRCVINQKGCSYDHSGGGYCTTDTFTQDCPYMKGYGNTKCISADQSWVDTWESLGGAGGNGTRCFNVKSQSQFSNKITDACYKSQCSSNGDLKVSMDGNWQTCQYQGQTLQGKKSQIICPNPAYFCSFEASCPNSCTSSGTCIKGVCQCFKGFTGSDCSQIDTTIQPPCASTETLAKNSQGVDNCCNSKTCCSIRSTPKDDGYCYCIAGTQWDASRFGCYYL